MVNSTNESMTSRTGVAGRILDAAGPELVYELQQNAMEPCKTGECRVTKAYQLPASWLIHTVGPRYNEKYVTAAENALHNCYRSCMEAAMEHRALTISFPVIHSTRRGYPLETGAHIAIRTVRRFLEKWGKTQFKRVILTMDNDEVFQLYSRILPLYFPRTAVELATAQVKLPKDTGSLSLSSPPFCEWLE
jgi:O-acetyl-ADP-ribose deacetylase (regulator of RNase III)